MIPTFPDFKRLSLDDEVDVKYYTNKYKPYSSFNFTNVWAWDTKEKRMVSELNGNLVFCLADYKTSEPFLSFLGTNDVENTTRKLINYAVESKISPTIRFLMEETINELKTKCVSIKEDIDSFDYIFSLHQLANLQGSKLKTKRHLSNKFKKENPNAIFKICDLGDINVQDKIISVLRRWENNKKNDNKIYDLEHEEIAIRRLLETASRHKLVLSCIYLDDIMLGFSIDEILPNKYAIAHFIKADNSFRGIYEFFNEEISRYLLRQGVLLWNWQQDLNIEGLRQLKTSYHPVGFLKKYSVSLDVQGNK